MFMKGNPFFTFTIDHHEFYRCSHQLVRFWSVLYMIDSARSSQCDPRNDVFFLVESLAPSWVMQDQSGYISLDELLNGYDKWPEFQEQMRLMDVEREDMQLGGELVSKIFYVHPYLGKWSNLTNILQIGWNHQLVSFVFFDDLFNGFYHGKSQIYHHLGESVVFLFFLAS